MEDIILSIHQYHTTGYYDYEMKYKIKNQITDINNKIIIRDDNYKHRFSGKLGKLSIINCKEIFLEGTDNIYYYSFKKLYIENVKDLHIPITYYFEKLIIMNLENLYFTHTHNITTNIDNNILMLLNNITIQNIIFPNNFILNNKDFSNFKTFFVEMKKNGDIDYNNIINLYKSNLIHTTIINNLENKIKQLEDKINTIENRW
jgi:hypothetical protein